MLEKLSDLYRAIRDRLAIFMFSASAERRLEFYRIMADTADHGIPQTEVVSMIEKTLPKGDGLRIVLERAMRGMRGYGGEGGQRMLSGELRHYLPPLEVAIITAGEESGRVSAGWRNAAAYLQSMLTLKRSIMSAMSKPTFYFLAFIGLLLFLSLKLIPTFETPERPRTTWPEMAQNLAWVSDHVVAIVMALIVLVLGLVALIAWAARNWTGNLRDSADRHWPGFSLLSAVSCAGFMVSISSFLASGVSITDGLARIKRTAPPYLAWQINRIERYMRSGLRPEEALIKTSLVPERYQWVVKLYGMASATDAASSYRYIAKEILDSVQRKVGVFVSGVLGNTMLVFLAAGILVVYFSLYEIAMSWSKAI